MDIPGTVMVCGVVNSGVVACQDMNSSEEGLEDRGRQGKTAQLCYR
jgi:hypothetical protein